MDTNLHMAGTPRIQNTSVTPGGISQNEENIPDYRLSCSAIYLNGTFC